MREILTQIEIHASASLVWDILTDFATYRRWNPLIRSVLGSARRGDTILVSEQRGNETKRTGLGGAGTKMVLRTVKHVRQPRELYWLGTWGLPSVLASERRFRIESLADGGVRFYQSERFRGAAVPFLWGLLRRRQGGFRGMNEALKARAERAHAEFEAKRSLPPM